MYTIPRGSFERLSSLPALWRAYQCCWRGKRRQPRMAAFDIDADRHICALHRALVADRYAPEPWRLRVIRDPKTRLIAAAFNPRSRRPPCPARRDWAALRAQFH